MAAASAGAVHIAASIVVAAIAVVDVCIPMRRGGGKRRKRLRYREWYGYCHWGSLRRGRLVLGVGQRGVVVSLW